MICTNVAAIIVAYNPSNESLIKLVSMISNQCNSIIILDNSEVNHIDSILKTMVGVKVIEFGENFGIAKAQNIGAEYAFNNGATDVLFFDQDSIPSLDLVLNLKRTFCDAMAKGVKVGAVGPQFYDQRIGSKSKFVNISNNKIKYIDSPQSKELYCEISFLISSGCLINREAWFAIGSNEEELFIDYVDMEWCFRAQSKGFQCIGSFIAKMEHSIGDAHIRIFGKNFTYHSPLRHYYFYRNFFKLLKRSYVPFVWKFHFFVKSIVQIFIFILFGHQKKLQFFMIMRGILDGILDKSGRLI